MSGKMPSPMDRTSRGGHLPGASGAAFKRLAMLVAVMPWFAPAAGPAQAPPPAVVINEFLASNGAVLADEDGDFEDWIEFYNPSPAPFNLAGYTLSDDAQQPLKWAFPDVWLEPEGVLLVWASGKDRRTAGRWNFAKPLTLSFESAGFYDGDFARIWVNGQDKSLNLRGINVVRLNAEGVYLESAVYDTYEQAHAAEALVQYLDSLLAGEIVLLAVKDEATTSLTLEARIALLKLGSQYMDMLGETDSWGMIAVIGQGKLAEAFSLSGQGPATASVASTSLLHTNFKLDKEGEYLGLYAPDGTMVDALEFGQQVRDASYGRQPDGTAHWCFFQTPTPNAINDAACASAVSQAPGFSSGGGVYGESVTVALSSPADAAEIHYTLDGSEPTTDSKRYDAPLVLDKTTVVRAGAFASGKIPSAIITQTYLINEDVHLPVLSLVTDPANLWDPIKGIYAEGLLPNHPNYQQRGQAWERPASVEFYEVDGSLGFAQAAGIRIHGGYTRVYPQKSFTLHFREQYGLTSLKYPLFSTPEFSKSGLERFDSLVLRNLGNDGNGARAHLRDPVMQSLWFEEGGVISAQRFVFVYLNGVPWGLYTLMEHIDEQYFASNFGAHDVDLLIGHDQVEIGNNLQWLSDYALFESRDLALAEHFEQARRLIDLSNFTDFQIFQIYSANVDLGDDNLLKFRPRSSDGQWRWVMWDMDHSFAQESFNPVSHDTLAWATREGPRPDLGPPWDDGADSLPFTLPLRKLLANETYRRDFINRFADLLNTTLSPPHVIARIDALASIIEPVMPREIALWQDVSGGSLEEWRADVQALRDFAQRRPDIVRQQVTEHFGLAGVVPLTIEPPEGEGAVLINTIVPSRYPWVGQYFMGVPVTLQAKAAPGYRFVRWSDSTLPQDPTVTVELTGNYALKAIFERQ